MKKFKAVYIDLKDKVSIKIKAPTRGAAVRALRKLADDYEKEDDNE